MIPTFQTTFAVHMTCESCVKDITDAVQRIDGITKVDADLAEQLVAVQGSSAPSAIVAAIQSTGRDAILRGSGAPNSAAVCILETHSTSVLDKVRGLARLVQVSPEATLFDVSIRGVAQGQYHVSIRQAGNISRGAESTGHVWEATKAREGGQTPRGMLGTLEVGASGIGSVFVDRPIQIWELIGRGMVVSKVNQGQFDKEDADTLVGVIARSAGVWDNDKTVCSCTGKTVWEERKEQTDRGML